MPPRRRGSTLHGQVNRTRRFRLDPVTKAAQRAVGGKRRANAGAEGVEGVHGEKEKPRPSGSESEERGRVAVGE